MFCGELLTRFTYQEHVKVRGQGRVAHLDDESLPMHTVESIEDLHWKRA